MTNLTLAGDGKEYFPNPTLAGVQALYTKEWRITPSNTHKDMWVFVNRKDNTSFSLTASIDWIRQYHKIIDDPQFDGEMERQKEKRKELLHRIQRNGFHRTRS